MSTPVLAYEESQKKVPLLNSELALTAAKQAAENITQYIHDRSKRLFSENKLSILKFCFGPNFDPCYFERVNYENMRGIDGFGSGSEIFLDEQRKNAKKLNMPSWNMEEQHLLYLANYLGRAKAAEGKDFVFAVKHFPGSNNETPFELTECREVFCNLSREEMEKGPLKPFKAVLNLQKSRQPKAIMIGHVSYPNFEEELKRLHPEIKLVDCGKNSLPASLSPSIIRGCLRKELGFEGFVISDWYNMGAIGEAINRIKPFLPENMQKLNNDAIAGILAVYAGVNLCGGGPLLYETYGPEMEAYHDSNKDFKGIFDALVLETLFLYTNLQPSDRRPNLGFDAETLSFSDLYADFSSLDSKKQKELAGMKKFVNELEFPLKLKILDPSLGMQKKHILSKNYDSVAILTSFGGADIWNRGALITLQFRKSFTESYFSEELQGKKFPELSADMPSEKFWVETLMEDPEFRKYYDAIDWNGAQMRSVYLNCFDELAKQNGGRYPQISGSVPFKIQ